MNEIEKINRMNSNVIKLLKIERKMHRHLVTSFSGLKLLFSWAVTIEIEKNNPPSIKFNRNRTFQRDKIAENSELQVGIRLCYSSPSRTATFGGALQISHSSQPLHPLHGRIPAQTDDSILFSNGAQWGKPIREVRHDVRILNAYIFVNSGS